jgi:hypothetical protein
LPEEDVLAVFVAKRTVFETMALPPVLCYVNIGIQMRLTKSTIAFLFVFGLLIFGMVSRHPKFASFDVLDIFELLFSGACFGVALVALIAGKRRIE